MKVKLKEGDLYVEVDTELSDDDVDILEKKKKISEEEDLEKTVEMELEAEKKNEVDENR